MLKSFICVKLIKSRFQSPRLHTYASHQGATLFFHSRQIKESNHEQEKPTPRSPNKRRSNSGIFSNCQRLWKSLPYGCSKRSNVDSIRQGINLAECGRRRRAENSTALTRQTETTCHGLPWVNPKDRRSFSCEGLHTRSAVISPMLRFFTLSPTWAWV